VLPSNASAMAIRAALFLALQPAGKLAPVRQIASQTGLPEPYLAKIVRQLVSAGLVRAYRGPGGGITLSRPPQAINLWDIVRAMEGSPATDWCVLGLQACSEQTPCPVHHQFAPIRADTRRLLEVTTLASLTNGRGERIRLDKECWARLPDEVIRRPSERLGKSKARSAKRPGTGK
jgi:Rrf2 family iron-sulfur cluster assembly transcriptional regulator